MQETSLVGGLDWKTKFLLLGFADIAFFFILFNPEQVFSLSVTIANLLLLALGVYFLLHADSADASGQLSEKSRRNVILLLFVSVAIVLYESYFILQYDTTAIAFIVAYLPVVVATLVSTVAIVVLANRFPKIEPKGLFSSETALIFVALVLVSLIATYIVTGTLHSFAWKGTDEIAFDYYSAHLLLNGTNPYTTSMLPVLKQFKLDPTLRLNSSCECQYGYPALSFLPFTLLQLIGLNIYSYTYVFVTVFLVTLAAFIVYYKSGRNNYALLPIALFVLSSFAWTPAGDMNFLAVSVFLLAAYLERNKLYLSSASLGLAASTHQLAWAAIPFFFVLEYNTYGRNWLLKSALISFATFLLVNAYFFALSPQAVLSNLFVFTGRLAYTGANLMQALTTFYPVPYWYPTLVMLALYAGSLILFYLYAGTLRSLLALVPATMFFFSWTNDFVYFLSFVPLLVSILYVDKEKMKDRSSNTKAIRYATLAFVVAAVAMLAYADSVYVRTNTLSLNGVVFTWYINSTTHTPALYSLGINVTNNGNAAEQLLFYAVSRGPNYHAYMVGVPTYSIDAHSTTNFTPQYSLNRITRNTKIFVYVMSNDYIQGAEYTIPLSPGG